MRIHLFYIFGSVSAAFMAAVGMLTEQPWLYGIIPGVIGGFMLALSAWRFLKHKVDLVGFVATASGFIFYQSFQANPVMLPEFVFGLAGIPMEDRMLGIVLANLTTAFLLGSCRLVSAAMYRPLRVLAPAGVRSERKHCDGLIVSAFWLLFAVVALPNVLFGKVVVGAVNNIIYQRLTWADAENFSGFSVWGGAVGGSVANLGLWATSLFLIWIYLLGSHQRVLMIWLGPLVVLWTASVAMQGSRTYLVTLASAMGVYFMGNPKWRGRSIGYALGGVILLFLCLQITTHFRGTGLQSVNFKELSGRILEIRGNEGAQSSMDGMEYFRTELLARDIAVNPLIGLVRGIVERPIEGLLMPVPRSLFPWKPFDESGREFNLFYQNVRLGTPSNEAFLGASPGLVGRELIKYGILGPLTLFFWFGLILALADRLFAVGASSDLHRMFAAVLVAFCVAQTRDFSPVWFIPFLPAIVVFFHATRRYSRQAPSRQALRVRPSVLAAPTRPGAIRRTLPRA